MDMGGDYDHVISNKVLSPWLVEASLNSFYKMHTV